MFVNEIAVGAFCYFHLFVLNSAHSSVFILGSVTVKIYLKENLFSLVKKLF